MTLGKKLGFIAFICFQSIIIILTGLYIYCLLVSKECDINSVQILTAQGVLMGYVWGTKSIANFKPKE